jgi:hypothetical protein
MYNKPFSNVIVFSSIFQFKKFKNSKYATPNLKTGFSPSSI